MKIQRIAFFDVDETLIDLKSMFSFRAFYFRFLWGNEKGGKAELAAARRIERHVRQGCDRSAINSLFYEAFHAHQPEQLSEAAQAWYAQERALPGFFIEPTLEALQAHQRSGDAVAFVSGAATQFLAPLAAELGVAHVLANRLETYRGRFTGRLLPPQTIGTGKRQAALALMSELGAAAEDCYAYGDHLSDLALLESVGTPIVVARDPALIRHAEQQGWSILQPTAAAPRGER
ncbi:HAD family hydrolase [Pseudomonas aeruginosa]|uniref:HAD family hydrolase n=1 Tax=Pseudomonas aeruginosa TaxID=287 RepID=UPI001558D251|nr:HAD-IB family hydrolase [Pseudomonas aeruginosa]MDG3815881.1 HAD-IB family hydrolase [Pseudomonas aeruginosa]NPW34586.1 HAD-IB family hydrolase [Pseudomonas aeruginosa]